MNSGTYERKELIEMGMKVGENVRVSRKSSIYSPQSIEIGDNVRIDDFCILSGNIKIGSNVHISAYTALYGRFGIEIGNYCGCSPRCTILSGSDDFSGNFMISPMVPEEYTNVDGRKVVMEDYSQLGANSIVMPGVTVKEGAVCGAFSFVNADLDEWTINVGIPAKALRKREENVKKLAKEYENEI